MSSDMNRSPWFSVYFINWTIFASALNSSSVVGVFPGAMICIGLQMSGLTSTPIYCKTGRILENFFFMYAVLGFLIFPLVFC